MQKHRKAIVDALFKGNLWHSDIYPSEDVLKKTLIAELKLNINNPIEGPQFEKAWDESLCKMFTENFNERTRAWQGVLSPHAP
jgi:hypothetical protein